MKLLFINLYSGEIERGAESFTHELIKRLGKNGHQVDLIAGKSVDLPTSQFSGSFVDKFLKRLFLDKPARQVFWFTLKNLSKIWKGKYDVVFPLNGFWQLLLVKFVQMFKGYKVIVTGHSGPGWDERWNLYLCPNWFVATTGPTLDWAKKTCFWTKSVLIPYGVEVDRKVVKNANDNKLISEIKKLERPIYLCPAALVPYKRVDLAIRAVSKLPKGSLLVLGKGGLEVELRGLGAKLLGSNRFLLDAVAHQEMQEIYKLIDVVTLPSHPQENSPMVFLEALAASKPIVATDSSRNRWMLEESAVYTDPENSNSYASGLDKALNIIIDKKVLEKFEWKSVLDKYEVLFKDKN